MRGLGERDGTPPFFRRPAVPPQVATQNLATPANTLKEELKVSWLKVERIEDNLQPSNLQPSNLQVTPKARVAALIN